ncbi:exopolyphosphatase / guanosine-5'-triphosphate,3'-diphosphate pyrophosphatase [Sporobacter termitidis DSM 10068]|uniref:Exopolyphosphatase / guanosine-5'-triphosphate,3'-diphosphate pyrophosphatase n=1 Tax=Sporobacter termitidis DSM 10068 TaxID=1123282 RepID=A0A1M5YY46_9FIRM|nr:hypothetical protein [Sporobacter termitidis]SHI16946.1 exopolyphosphatase / guanosine-5'-triphosphate,3'-diphosphate pyrophosphatase [Sporobacter termitidis DSM 10068]
MIHGIIDIGANSIRLTLYEVDNGDIRLILSKKSVAGLAGYVESDILQPKGIQKACDVLNNFKDVLSSFGIGQVDVFATASLRNIANSQAATGEIEARTGLPIRLLSGEEEARLGYLGASRSAAMSSGLFADIGGGSTELVTFENGAVLRALSLPYGSLNLSLKYVKGITPHKSNILSMKQELRRELKRTKLFDLSGRLDLCASGGTARAARKIYNDIYELPGDNDILEFEKFSGILVKYNDERRDITRRLKQLVPDRIHTIIPGIVILQTLGTMCQSQFISVVATGIREGYLVEHVLPAPRQSPAP